MTADQLAIRDAILRDPSDDGLRLAYADAARDAGEVERAEFVELGLQQAELEAGGHRSATVEEVVAIGGRLNDLTEQMAGQWVSVGACELGNGFRVRYDRIDGKMGWLEDSTIPMRVLFTRGFVSEVQCSLAAFMEHAGAIFAEHPVEAVRLVDREPTNRYIRDGSNAHEEFAWCVDPSNHVFPDNRFMIPASIIKHLPLNTPRWAQYFRLFRSRDAALFALSDAAVLYGRTLAGLPPLAVRTPCGCPAR